MIRGVAVVAFAGALSGQNPPGFIPPPLNPTGAVLRTEKLGDGVYALLSSKPFTDNGGFIVGEKGVLVIDANFNGKMARQVLDSVAAVTGKPILFLVNTNGFPDHTFGNYVFPASTHIIGHRLTAERMTDLAAAKQRMLPTVDNDKSVYADAEWRLPDIVFDEHLRIDLGGRTVDIHYFGPGNTPGDTIVFEPATGAAWTGNMVFGEGTIPWLNTGTLAGYQATLDKFRRTLAVRRIIPGHGRETSGQILEQYSAYLAELKGQVQTSVDSHQTLEQALAAIPLGPQYLSTTPEPLRALMNGFHRFNIQRAYQEIANR
jgi:cyclase